ncbi:unnamed protein product, partial [marine sediment metagenome]
QETKDYTFATIDDGPGGFTEYLLYRNPNSYGYGISLSRPYDQSRLDLTHFNISRDKNYLSFVHYVREVEATGVKVVVNNRSENQNLSDFIQKIIVTLSIIEPGGSFVSTLPLLDNELIIDVLYTVSKCFDRISLFKPISTVSYDKHYYLVAEKAKTNNIEWISYLNEVCSKSDLGLIRLLENVPSEFVDWVVEYNNFMLLYNKYLVSSEGIGRMYDTYKCKAIWNLPQL